MFEKYEKWFVLGIIAVVIYWLYKKGASVQQAAPQVGGAFADLLAQRSTPIETTMIPATGSLVAPPDEVGATYPAQTTSPLVFTPAQPSSVGKSQLVSAGSFDWYPAPPVLRMPPADIGLPTLRNPNFGPVYRANNFQRVA